MYKQEKKYLPVQMIGTQRSGSNLLRLMLNELDSVVAPHPPHILERFFPLLSYYGNLDKNDNFKMLVKDVCKLTELNPVPWNIELNPKKIYERCSKHTLIEVFKVLYDFLAEQNQKKIWCCKSLANVHFLDKIEEEGLKPFYIYLFRDGRDVALSFKKTIVGEKHIYCIAKQWKEEQDLAINHCNKIESSRVIKVRYEDFIQNPEKTIHEICHFLKIHYRKKVMEYYESDESKTTAQSGIMWQNVVKPVIKNNYNKYLSELSEDEIFIFEAVAGDTLNSLGYKTHFYNSFTKLVLNDEHIAGFKKINEDLKLKIIDNTPAQDILKRKPQNDFINSIKNKI
jgi:hypothetical protein